ncbi:MAG: hypothetical protein KC449_30225, partial [Anaerolineales bacterium]|nr:hypothetical protein [Anaerolineales bacterium]
APTTTPTTAAATSNDTDTTTSSDTSNTGSTTTSDSSTESTDTSANTTVEAVDNNKINLNDMAQDELLNTIPDFSSRMVREFFEYQPYISIQQFRREIGKYVSDDVVAQYEQYVYVPVDVDNSDAATIQQIPGVDETIADALIAARPFGSNEAFLAKLGEYMSADQVAAAAGYLATP